MKNLKTKYLGIELKNPVIVGASNIAANLDKLKKAEELGAAAIVYKSLFEEQIQLERYKLDERLNEYNDLHAEMLTTHPHIEHAGPDEHLLNIRKAKEALSIPLIASLNAVSDDTWLKYAKLLSETGVDGLELNFYQIPLDFNKSAKDIEAEQLNIAKEIKNNISIPVSVKLSPDYSNILNFIQKLDKAGVDGFVLFNSFFSLMWIQLMKNISNHLISAMKEITGNLSGMPVCYTKILKLISAAATEYLTARM